MEQSEDRFEMWARVDLFGHKRRAGKLTTINTGVEVLYRLDVPNGDGFLTEFYGCGAVYSVLPCTEETARLAAKSLGDTSPISFYDLPLEWRKAIQGYKELTAGESVGGESLPRDHFTEEPDLQEDDDEGEEEDRYP